MPHPTAYISVAEASSLWVAQHLSRSSKRYFEAGEHFLIVPDSQVTVFSDLCPGLVVLPESQFVSRETASKLREALHAEGNSKRFGWYLQQYIKLSALDRFRKQYERLVLWDADGIALRPIEFFDSSNQPLPYFSSERNQPYFDLLSRIAPEVIPKSRSFIAQCFPVTKAQLDSFFARFGGSAHSLFEILNENIDFSQFCGLSEYELLGNVIYAHGDPFWKPGNRWSRYGNHWIYPHQIDGFASRILSSIFDFVSFESASVSLPEKVRGAIQWAPRLILNGMVNSTLPLKRYRAKSGSSVFDIKDELHMFAQVLFQTSVSRPIRLTSFGADGNCILNLLRSIAKPSSLNGHRKSYWPDRAIARTGQSKRPPKVGLGAAQNKQANFSFQYFSIDPHVYNLILTEEQSSKEVMDSSYSLRSLRKSLLLGIQGSVRLRRQLPLFLASIHGVKVDVNFSFDPHLGESPDVLVLGSKLDLSSDIQRIAALQAQVIIVSGILPSAEVVNSILEMGYRNSPQYMGVVFLSSHI
jgi:hypothetical protein